MAANPEKDASDPILIEKENYREMLDELSKEVTHVQSFKDKFYENYPAEKSNERDSMITEKRLKLTAKFEAIDEACVPSEERARFLYLKGCCYNISSAYNLHAFECLSRAVKLDPTNVPAWNELGECYWKNGNLKLAISCFEGALNKTRHRVTLRSLSVLLRQDNAVNDKPEAINRSVEYAKQAVALEPKDGMSWSILGNAYMCQYFMVTQDPVTLKLAMSAYKQAWLDPIARRHPDLHYNKGMALKYEESYSEAIESFVTAHRLDPQWEPPITELKGLIQHLTFVDHLLKNKGKIKAKRIMQMVKSMEPSMFADYQIGSEVTLNKRKVTLKHVKIADLKDGDNPSTVVMGRVIGSLVTNKSVPFTFAIIDESMVCIAVNVYNLANGRGVIIGDCVAIPEPRVSSHNDRVTYPEVIEYENNFDSKTNNGAKENELAYEFRAIRVNNPTELRVNGKRVSMTQFASTRVTSTYEAH